MVEPEKKSVSALKAMFEQNSAQQQVEFKPKPRAQTIKKADNSWIKSDASKSEVQTSSSKPAPGRLNTASWIKNDDATSSTVTNASTKPAPKKLDNSWIKNQETTSSTVTNASTTSKPVVGASKPTGGDSSWIKKREDSNSPRVNPFKKQLEEEKKIREMKKMGTFVEKQEEKKELKPGSRPVGRVDTSKFEQASADQQAASKPVVDKPIGRIDTSKFEQVASKEQESKPFKKPIGRVDTSKFEQQSNTEQQQPKPSSTRPIGKIDTSKFDQATTDSQPKPHPKQDKPLSRPVGKVDTSWLNKANQEETKDRPKPQPKIEKSKTIKEDGTIDEGSDFKNSLAALLAKGGAGPRKATIQAKTKIELPEEKKSIKLQLYESDSDDADEPGAKTKIEKLELQQAKQMSKESEAKLSVPKVAGYRKPSTKVAYNFDDF